MSGARVRRKRIRRPLEVLGALTASLALLAVAGTSAQAATWTVEGSKISEKISLESGLKKETTAKLVGKVLGSEIVITAQKMAGSEGVIIQSGSVAKTSGIIEFSELSVDTPAGCKVESPIKTKTLTSEAVDHSGNVHAFGKAFPEEGEVFATIKISGCAIAGSYNVKGTVYGEAEEWGTALATQPIKTTPAINETLGGSLTLGTSAATMTAESVGNLASGKKFSIDT